MFHAVILFSSFYDTCMHSQFIIDIWQFIYNMHSFTPVPEL